MLLVEGLLGLIAFLLGAALFSFMNVVAWRLPRNMDPLKGRSICPRCGRTLDAPDLVPVFSWLFLRGRCRHCRAPIPVRYLLVELLGGVLALDYAAYRPERIASLVLIGTPCAMPKRLLKIQDLLFALMPRKLFTGLGMTKRQVRGLAASMAEGDIPALLPRVRCRTLVLCGEKDRANRKAARQLQEGLSNAAMQTIDGAGHEANREAPEALSAALAAFYGAD